MGPSTQRRDVTDGLREDVVDVVVMDLCGGWFLLGIIGIWFFWLFVVLGLLRLVQPRREQRAIIFITLSMFSLCSIVSLLAKACFAKTGHSLAV